MTIFTDPRARLRTSLATVDSRDLLARWLPWALRLLAIVLGGLHIWAAITSNSMNPDGIAYLEMGEAYLRGDWRVATNGYWSPLYGLLLAVGIRLLDPALDWGFAVFHVVNLAIYLVTFVSFEFFWRQLTLWRLDDRAHGSGLPLPEWAWQPLGYVLFIWSALGLIQIWAVTPDMLVAAWVYLAAGQILRIRRGAMDRRTFALLGLILGFAFLTKAVMLPLTFVFLGVSLVKVGNARRAASLALVTLVAVALVAGPHVIALSQIKGRLTFGDAGKLNYVRIVNGLPHAHWQGDTPENGTPIHPTRQILDQPPIYEFATPIQATYPPWYDHSYWYEGAILRFDWRAQARVLLRSALFYVDLFVHQQAALLIGTLLLYGLAWRRRRIGDIIQRWGLALVALVVLGLYGLVYVEGRYFGPFIVLLWGDLLAGVRLPDSQLSRRALGVIGTVMVLFMLTNIGAQNLQGLTRLSGSAGGAQSGSPVSASGRPAEVAQGLHHLGIAPGDQVAIIGYGFDSFWAKLAHVQIVAEMPWEHAGPIWMGDSAVQSLVIEHFATTGARAVVAERVPDAARLIGWQRIGETSYYLYPLDPLPDARPTSIAPQHSSGRGN